MTPSTNEIRYPHMFMRKVKNKFSYLYTEVCIRQEKKLYARGEDGKLLKLTIVSAENDPEQMIIDQINGGEKFFLLEGVEYNDSKEILADSVVPGDIYRTFRGHGFEIDADVLSAMTSLKNEQRISIIDDLKYYYGETDKPYPIETFLDYTALKHKYTLLKRTGILENTDHIDETVSKVEKRFTSDNSKQRETKRLRYLLNVFWKRHKTLKNRRTTSVKAQINKALSTHILAPEIKTALAELIYDIKTNPAFEKKALLLVGPPACGKTTISISIAQALGYPSFTVPLGGSSESSQIKGGEVNYSNSEESTVAKGILRCRTSSCVCVMEELEKTHESPYGNPQQALLSLIDNSQVFTDECLEIPIDVKNTLFIFTANSLDGLSEPLLSRMKVIHFDAPSFSDKVEIIEKKMIPRIKEHYKDIRLVLSRESIIKLCCKRNDLRTIDNDIKGAFMHCRYKYGRKRIVIDNTSFDEFFAFKRKPAMFFGEQISYALAVDNITNIGLTIPMQAVVDHNQKGGIRQLTGNADKSFEESFSVACFVFDKYMESEGLEGKRSIYLHFLDGVKKAGYSGGLAMLAAILAAEFGLDIGGYAFTGALGLDGTVFPVGGVYEKLIAAENSGLRKVFIPLHNYQSLDPSFISAVNTEIVPVSNIECFLKYLRSFANEEKKRHR